VSRQPEVLGKRWLWRVPARRLNRPPLLFLSGQTVSVLGDGLAVLAIPLLVLDLTRNPLLSGLSAASVTVGYLLVGLPAGVLVDRLDPWRVLIAMDAARALLFAALYALSAAGGLRIWALFALALSAGACSVFFESALVVVVKDLFAGSSLMGANSALELASQISLIAGPAIVGLLAAAGGINLALLADALTFAVSLASLVAVTRNRPELLGPAVPDPCDPAGPGQRVGRGPNSRPASGGPALPVHGAPPAHPHCGPDGGEPVPLRRETDHL
jgi:MFS family permease